MSEEVVEYCFNPKTQELVEGKVPPNDDFIPIIGYFKRGTDPVELKKKIAEIAALQELAFDVDQYAEDETESRAPPPATKN